MNNSNIINNKSSQDNDESNKNSDSESNSEPKVTQLVIEENKNLNIEVLPESTNKHDLSFKVIIIGDSGVGKSSLANKAIKNKFESNYNATIGFDCFQFYVKINNKIIKLQVWDTCGQEAYQSLITNFYRNCSLAIMVYSINKRNTYDKIPHHLKTDKNEGGLWSDFSLSGNKTRGLTDQSSSLYSNNGSYMSNKNNQ